MLFTLTFESIVKYVKRTNGGNVGIKSQWLGILYYQGILSAHELGHPKSSGAYGGFW